MAGLMYRVLSALQPVLFPDPALHPLQTQAIKWSLLVYAHRGGPLDPASKSALIENTLPAFRHAAGLHVDLLELDVQLTKDKQVVVVHDTKLSRLCGPAFKDLQVKDLNYSELPRLLNSPAQAQQLPTEDTAYQIPLLKDVFQEFPGIPIQIDLKVDTPGLPQAVHELIVSNGRRESVLWGSFRHKVNCQLYTLDRGIPLFTSGWRAIYLRGAHAAGFMDKVHIYESATIVPWRFPRLWGKGHWYPFLDRSWCQALAARGVSVIMFGKDLNSASAYEQCLAAGAVGVCTDCPSLLQAYLKKA